MNVTWRYFCRLYNKDINQKIKIMLRQFTFIFALFALNANANAETKNDPLTNFFSLEIEKLELEQELFDYKLKSDEISIESIDLYEVEEEVEIEFDTAKYVPEGFNPKKGMEEIDWDTISRYEIEEEINRGFDTKDYLPKNFNPYCGMPLENLTKISLLQKKKMRY
jgi:type VI protein secretion system component VasA